MSVTYNVSEKKWSFNPRAEEALKEVSYPPVKNYLNISWVGKIYDTGDGGEFVKQAKSVSISNEPIQESTVTTTGYRGTGSKTTGTISIPLPDVNNLENIRKIRDDFYYDLPDDLESADAYNALQNFGTDALNKFKTAQSNEKINQEVIEPYNKEVRTYNQNLPKAEQIINTTKGGDYVSQRDALKTLGIAGIEDNFKAFYLTEKLQPWNSDLGSKPLYGDFDPSYYKKQNPELEQKYKDALKNDDVDIVNRYGENGYYLWHYTTQGKPAGLRGNAPEGTVQADSYVEKKPTDKDIQLVRDLQLGINTQTQTNRLLNIPEIAAEWEKAKNNDPYWKRLAKEKFLNPDKPDEFAVLFRLSERPEDQQIRMDYNVNAGYGITQLEDALNEAVGEKAVVDVKKFGALTQNVLNDTIQEMKKAKQKEGMLGLLGGLGGFNEIIDINKELTNSILGDSGVGGMLAFTSGGKAEESLEKSLQNITGVRNNTTYNWQQWFDGQLKKKYEQDLELGYTTAEAKETVKIEADFARKFIDEYLIPRFNTARSMDEFKEYLDVRQEEQNPFQTQDMLNAVTQVANLRAEQYLDTIKNTDDRYFDAEFYFNPTGNEAAQDRYAEQASTVSQDWEDAKKGDPYWQQQTYRFGLDVNDKNQFAKMHFQVKGQGKGYDPAKDILSAGRVKDEIYNKILPALKEEALKQGTIFGQFITPDEFADEMLKGLDPANKEEWNDVLKKFGLTDFKGTVDELREYVAETLRTGSAQEIREQIKYLNEKRRKPTQQVLGLTYIEREEDYKDQQAKPETELYKVFQSAGFQGTEDEFYENFFPDVDRSEQTLLTKAGSDSALKIEGLDFKDPFASLGTIESFFSEDEKIALDDDEDTVPKSSSFFSLGLDDEEKTDYKSKTGSQILGEFTSMFKGL